MIKLILCDVDGTLLNTKHQIDERTKKTIKALKENDIEFGLATGRNAHAVSPLLKGWDLEDEVKVIIGTNGAQIVDLENNNETILGKLSAEAIKEVLTKYKNDKAAITISEKLDLFSNKDTVEVHSHAHANSCDIKFINTDDFNSFDNIIKIILISDEKHLDYLEELEETHDSSLYTVVRTTPNLLEFQANGISKGHAINFLADKKCINISDICVFGDGLNDLEMFEIDTHSVAMDNAHSTLKENAKYHTRSNDENGIGHYIVNNILK